MSNQVQVLINVCYDTNKHKVSGFSNWDWPFLYRVNQIRGRGSGEATKWGELTWALFVCLINCIYEWVCECARTSALQLTPFASVASLFGVIYEFIICRTSQTRERVRGERKDGRQLVVPTPLACSMSVSSPAKLRNGMTAEQTYKRRDRDLPHTQLTRDATPHTKREAV